MMLERECSVSIETGVSLFPWRCVRPSGGMSLWCEQRDAELVLETDEC